MQTIGRKIHHDSSFPPLRFVFAITLSTYTQGYLCYLFYTHMPLSSIFNSRMKVFLPQNMLVTTAKGRLSYLRH
jgi:hypothetical protein